MFHLASVDGSGKLDLCGPQGIKDLLQGDVGGL